MSGFYQQPFSVRLGKMGDEAEAVFADVAPLGKVERYGLRRPDISMKFLSPFLRYTPDCITSQGALVEVVGLGGDDVLKFKVEKLAALSEWNKNEAVHLFVWHKKRREWLLTMFPAFRRFAQVTAKQGTKRFPDDNKEYIPLPWRGLTLIKGIVRGEYGGET